MAWFSFPVFTTLVLLQSVLISLSWKKFSSESKPLLDTRLDSILPILDKVKATKEYGLLHTIKAYIVWSTKEEKLVSGFKLRLEQLNLNREIIKGYTVFRESNSNLVNLLAVIVKLRKNHKSFIYLNELELRSNGSSFKNEWIGFEDLQMSLTGILNLQVTYLISAKKMANGLNIDSKYGGLLSHLDCIILGLYSLIKKRFVTAVLWLQVEKLTISKKYESNFLTTLYSIGIQTHNSNFLLVPPTKKDYRNDVVEDLYQESILNEILPPNQKSNKMLHFHKYRGNNSEFRFTKLCNGYSLQSSKIKSKLKCYLEYKKHPYLYINPIKIEQLSDNPSILQFYEIMSNSSINIIEKEIGSHATITHMWIDKDNVAHPLYQSAHVSAATSARMTISNFGKTFKNSHFLINILTGLSAPNDPNNNMYNEHVYGRHFRLHTDGIYTESLTNMPVDDDMVASMVLYLKLPIIGGCTAFVNVGVCSRTVQGSAIFWHNMYKNGTYTRELAHGGCPVYHGYKMSISFFFKYNTNWNKRTCSLNRLE